MSQTSFVIEAQVAELMRMASEHAALREAVRHFLRFENVTLSDDQIRARHRLIEMVGMVLEPKS